jgi:hypothetical protein
MSVESLHLPALSAASMRQAVEEIASDEPREFPFAIPDAVKENSQSQRSTAHTAPSTANPTAIQNSKFFRLARLRSFVT